MENLVRMLVESTYCIHTVNYLYLSHISLKPLFLCLLLRKVIQGAALCVPTKILIVFMEKVNIFKYDHAI